MPHPTREGLPESTQVLLAWGLPASESHEGALDDVLLWLTGGAGLLLWTGIALWLTG